MRRVLAWTGPLLASALACGAAQAGDPLPRYGVFVFSNLCREPSSGDYRGSRIKVMRQKDGDSAQFMYGHTSLVGPTRVKGVSIDAMGNLDGLAETDDGEVYLSAALEAQSGTLKAFDAKPQPVQRIVDMDQTAPVCP